MNWAQADVPTTSNKINQNNHDNLGNSRQSWLVFHSHEQSPNTEIQSQKKIVRPLKILHKERIEFIFNNGRKNEVNYSIKHTNRMQIPSNTDQINNLDNKMDRNT